MIGAERHGESLRRRSEWELAYAPWLSDQNMKSWESAQNHIQGQSESIPPIQSTRVPVMGGLSVEYVDDFQAMLSTGLKARGLFLTLARRP